MKKRRIWIFVTALTLCLIWAHSAMGKESSSAESAWVYQHVKWFLGLFFGPERVTEHFIRKLAHVTEYFVLGVDMLLLNWERVETQIGAAFDVLLRCSFCALIDETIQIFSGRGPSIRDVWLDTFGAAAGIITTRFVITLWKMVFSKKEERTGE